MVALVYWVRHTVDVDPTTVRVLSDRQFVTDTSRNQHLVIDLDLPTPRDFSGMAQSGSDKIEWGVRTVDPLHCPNGWHQTGTARRHLACPECPPARSVLDNGQQVETPAPEVEYRVWALVGDHWLPMSTPFAKRKDAEKWARCLNAEYRIDKEDKD